MIRVLGLIDLFAAIILVFTGINHEVPIGSAIILSIILFFKAFIGSFDIASAIDVFAAIVMISGVFVSLPFIFLLIVAILIGQKGLISVFS